MRQYFISCACVCVCVLRGGVSESSAYDLKL